MTLDVYRDMWGIPFGNEGSPILSNRFQVTLCISNARPAARVVRDILFDDGFALEVPLDI